MAATESKGIQSNGVSILDLILKKKRGDALTKEEIEFFVQGVVDDAIAREQLGRYITCVVCWRAKKQTFASA